MARAERVICASAALADRGKGVRFMVEHQGRPEPAFAVRHDSVVRAYLNLCAHRPVELDMPQGEFFDSSGVYLVCTLHGAAYEPGTGRCVMGPCTRDERLVPLQVQERGGKVYLILDGTPHG